MEMIPSPWLGFLRGVFLANHLASNDNLTRTTIRQNTYQRKLTIHKRTLINNNTIKNMLRYKTDRTCFSSLFTTSGQEMEWAYSYKPVEPARG